MFESVTGQARAMERLKADINAGRLAESYIFAGPEGAGKRAAALEFAKAVNGGVSHEIFVLDFESQTELLDLKEEKAAKQKEYKIESIRALLGRAHLTSLEAKKKVVIIDCAEALSPAAANALLKVLEESPRQCLWILVTASPERLPITVRSRCRKVWFSPPEAEALASFNPVSSALFGLAAEIGKPRGPSGLSLSAQALAAGKKLGGKKAAEQFLKFLAARLAKNLRENPEERGADGLLSVLEALQLLSRNVAPQIALDALLVSLEK